MLDYDSILSTGLQAMVAACETTAQIQSSFDPSDALTKDDRSPVTIADFASQVIISHLVSAAFPEFGMISEENADQLSRPENAGQLRQVHAHVRRHASDLTESDVCDILSHDGHPDRDIAWALDPIDGTKGFMRGDQYAVALALLERGRIVAGFMGCPQYRTGDTSVPSIFYAAQGQGAFRCDMSTPAAAESIRVDAIDDIRDARLIQGVEVAHADLGLVDIMRKQLDIRPECLRMDGQGKYAAVAGGDVSAYLRVPKTGSARAEFIWDHAAGVVLVEEAGGTATDANGETLDFSLGDRLSANSGIVATNRRLHGDVLEAIQAVRQAS